MKKYIPFTVISMLFIIVLVSLELFKPEPEKKQFKPKKLKVFVEKTRQQDTLLYAFAHGEAAPKHQVLIKSQIEGEVTFVSPDLTEGGRVKSGQLLLTLDDRNLQLELVQRQANVAKSAQQLTKVQVQARVAKQELNDLGRKNPDDLALWLPQLTHAEAELKAAEALLKRTELAIERTQVFAPFDAIVRSEKVERGQLVSKNNELATLYATDVMEVRLALSGEQLDLLDLPIDFFVEDYDSGRDLEIFAEVGKQQLSWQAKLMRTTGHFDTRTRTIDVIAQVIPQTNQPLLLPGLYVNAKIAGRTVKNATKIDRTSLRPNNKVWFVDQDNLLQYETVEPVYRTQDYVVVTGLPNKTSVVTSALVAPTPGTLVATLSNKANKSLAKAQR